MAPVSSLENLKENWMFCITKERIYPKSFLTNLVLPYAKLPCFENNELLYFKILKLIKDLLFSG